MPPRKGYDTMVGAQSEFAYRFQEFVFYAGPIVQILYWVTLAVAAVVAVVLLKRWVDFQTGAATSAAEEDVRSSERSAPVNVDEFVE